VSPKSSPEQVVHDAWYQEVAPNLNAVTDEE
jgi:hypothetical protein